MPPLAVLPPVDRDDPATWRAHFPALAQRVNGSPLTFLDTAATAQRPEVVIDAVARFYREDNANPGRTLHTLARRADAHLEGARAAVAKFIGATDPLEIVFTRGTTEGINLVAATWLPSHLAAGDEVLLTISDHSSAMLPLQRAAKAAGAEVRYVDITPDGELRLDDFERKLTGRTRLVCFPHVSNVLGTVNQAKQLTALARAKGARVLIDAAQSVPHLPVSVRDLDADFLVFSSHKVMGPMGVGVLWARRALLDAMPPYQSGSNMAHEVDLDSADYSPGALKFGAGTPNVSGPVGLAAALRFVEQIGFDAVIRHEATLTDALLGRLRDVPGVRVLGSSIPGAHRIGVVSFTSDRLSPQDLVTRLDADGVAIRAGDLAALPLLKRLGVTRAARASLYLYNDLPDIERFGHALARAVAA